MRFDSSTFILSTFHPVDEKRCFLKSLALYLENFLCLDEKRLKIKTLVKAQSEVYTGRM